MYMNANKTRRASSHPTTDASNARPGHTTSVRQQGSLLILCVTVLVIIALIGIAYLQRVRMDQYATARHERSYVNTVINGILGEVSDQLQYDLVANQSKGYLLYDYPYTDTNTTDYETTSEYTSSSKSGQTVRVNGFEHSKDVAPFDDRWLASTAPVWVPADNEYHWLHLTNLTGMFIDLPEEDPDASQYPLESFILFNRGQIGQAIFGNATRYYASDTDIAMSDNRYLGLRGTIPGYQMRGVDADGDGFVDSRWQWAPESVRSLGGRKYVMATRIVDLSSMINVNTAGAICFTAAMDEPYVARGYNPAWVDLSRLFSRTHTPYGSRWRQELTALLNFRIDNLVQNNQITDYYGDNLTYILESTRDVGVMWQKQGSIYGNVDRNYVMDAELELRRFGGLNDTSLTSVLESEMGQDFPANQDQVSRLLRQQPSVAINEASFWDVVKNIYPALPENESGYRRAIAGWFYGAANGSLPVDDTDSLRVANREFPAIRHMLTAASGTGIYAPVLQDEAAVGGSPASGSIKYALNDEWSTDAGVNATKLTKLEKQLRQTFKRTRRNLGNYYLGLDASQIEDFIAEYALAIKDYSDEGSIPSNTTISTGDEVFGLERLPFLREVYCQALYEDTGDNVDALGAAVSDGIPDTWEVVPDTQAMAIELGNPFSHNILDSELDQLIRIRISQGGSTVSTWIYDASRPGSDNLLARDDTTTTDPDDIMIIVSDAADGPGSKNDNGAGEGDNLELDLNLDSASKPNLVVVQAPNGSLTFDTDGSTITVELQVEVDSKGAGNWVTYDRMETTLSFPDEEGPHAQDAAPAVSQHIQKSFWRDSEYIRYVSADTDTGSASSSLDSTKDSTPGGVYSATVPNFTKDIKGAVAGGTWTPPDTFQLAIPDRPMLSMTEMAMVHVFGFTRTESFSERIASPPAHVASRDFLVVDPNDSEYDVIDYPFGVPHAALLMDLFTTVSPRYDGKDNDNDDGNENVDDGDSENEFLVPGTININTAPLHILTLASPIGETLGDVEKLMRAIIAYRDEPIRGSKWRPTNSHGSYWSPAVAGFDVDEIRNNGFAGRPEHLTNFVNSAVPDDRLNQPGIASLGEVMYLNPNPSSDLATCMMGYGLDTANSLSGANFDVDMYPDPSEVTKGNASAIDEGDDNEQLLARFGMLSQAYTVRSDRFAVYCVVRGYKDAKFNTAPEESARFIAIIDRGTMKTDGSESPRIIGFIRLQ